MKQYREITPSVCRSALRHFWKRVLACTLILTLLGAGAGYWYVFHRSGVSAAEAAVSVEPPEYEPLIVTADYYADRLTLLQTAASNLKTLQSGLASYTAYRSADDLPADPLAKTAAQEMLEDLSARLSALIENDLPTLDDQLVLLDCYPEALIDSRLVALARTLEEANDQLLLSTEAVELLKSMDAPDRANEWTLSEYNTLLFRARMLGDTKLTLETVRKEQAVFSDRAAIAADNQAAESALDALASELDGMYRETEALMVPLAQTQNLVFTAGVGVDPAEDRSLYALYVTHTSRDVPPAEDFAAIVIFCALCGVCIGLFAALCGETKRPTEQ